MGRLAWIWLLTAIPALARADRARDLERGCEAGDPSACLAVAELEERRGDARRALGFYVKACEGNIGKACGRAGDLLDSGKGARPSHARAARLYQKGCKLKDGLACRNLAALHFGGRGVKRSIAKALDLLDRACGYDHAQACDALGRVYFAGEGVKRDRSEADRFFRLACEGGYEQACGRVKGAASPAGADRVRRARAACDGGDHLGCVTLGYMYLAGLGIGQDHVRALGLFEKACAADEAAGCRFLATMYERGHGVRADAGRAARISRKACDLDASACQEEPQ